MTGVRGLRVLSGAAFLALAVYWHDGGAAFIAAGFLVWAART